jgi:D-tagatose-1,6-bisphosphate aldolase subunit GatZ/KbaZ
MVGEMQRDPRHWSAYYVNPERQDFDLQYSLSDRIRYYWTAPVAVRACTYLFECLAARGIPMTLISQHLPMQYAAIREGRQNNDPRELVVDAVQQVLCHYERACRPGVAAGGAAIDRGRE